MLNKMVSLIQILRTINNNGEFWRHQNPDFSFCKSTATVKFVLALKLIQLITEKLKILLPNVPPTLDEFSKARAEGMFQQFVYNMTGKGQIIDTDKEDEGK